MQPSNHLTQTHFQHNVTLNALPKLIRSMFAMIPIITVVFWVTGDLNQAHVLVQLILVVVTAAMWFCLRINRVKLVVAGALLYGLIVSVLLIYSQGAHWVFLMGLMMVPTYSWMMMPRLPAFLASLFAVVIGLAIVYVRAENVLLITNELTGVQLAVIVLMNFAATTAIAYQLSSAIALKNAQLLDSEARYRTVTSAAPSGIVLIDKFGQILFVNAAVIEIFGYEVQELVKQPFTMLLGTAAAYDFEADLGRYHRTKSEPISWQRVKAVSQRSDGRTIQLQLSIEHVQMASDFQLVCYMQDVTEQQALEAMMIKSQELDSLGALAGGIAHDFNNLLSAMLSQSSLALYQLEHGLSPEKSINKMVSAARKASQLTNKMLAYSGRSRFEVGPQDVNVLIVENLQLLLSGIDKQIEVHAHLNDNLPSIEADPAQLQQIVMNLLINSADAIQDSGQPGEISILTTACTLEEDSIELGHITGEPLKAGDYLVLSVADTGPGMSEETIERIFNPFFTTKSDGNGLGLAAVLGSIRAHKGGLSVHSELSVGTVFEVLLPIGVGGREEVDEAPSIPELASVVA